MRIAGKTMLMAILPVAFLASCGGKDFCDYLAIEEARAFDPDISKTEMRQTERILYCVYQTPDSDRLFISLDKALGHAPQDFLRVVAQNSPEPYEEIRLVHGAGGEGAVLFLGDQPGSLKMEFVLLQNQEFSVLIRARGVTNGETEKLETLRTIAARVLSRL